MLNVRCVPGPPIFHSRCLQDANAAQTCLEGDIGLPDGVVSTDGCALTLDVSYNWTDALDPGVDTYDLSGKCGLIAPWPP